ncbi:CRISPR-associated helicase/endonuclease Cas3 [Paenibacillus sp. UNC499MF]|uniref:CRISPR-associated helicase/endonuclease Cas3 n=1 Tax=Paenibacillus sp. UNC499MF TaxID=1502751 RepID=UPI0008A08D92|nr:CRISPR-associated helicase/endonuclease Cas3 [Paenibacillus sp. UNC499MF]SEG63828.1 CRISPR-associated helicase, Cas3 family [Paenibacillus sp. UNC499MF]
MEFIAHIRESDGEHQSVEDHLLGVQTLAESYGEGIGIKHIAGLAGLLHDLGKYTVAFQEYLLKALRNPEAPPKKGSVDHSTAGGRLLYQLFHTGRIERDKGVLAEIVGNAILSHHSYLQDFLNPESESNYLQRVRDKEAKELSELPQVVQCFFEKVIREEEFYRYVEQAALELKIFLAQESPLSLEARCMFLTKYVFSALIDADRTNTRCFEENIPDVPVKRPPKELFGTFYDRLMAEIESLTEHSKADSSIKTLRREMSEQCDKFAEKSSGIYTLSIPTGGGKTLASLRYALKHAQMYGKKRIIFVLPYTTIIEQNAAEVRRVLKDVEHILEHHSNVIEDENDEDEHMDGKVNMRQKLKLAKDNWDSPIIFTTMVQFLNVFYAKSSRDIRRLHHLSESVLVFDEVQKVPVSCVSLFNMAMNFLNQFCSSSIVLCTATQPALGFVEHKLHLSPKAEMVANLGDVIAAFKRVEIVDRATDERFNTDKLTEFVAERMKDAQSALVILNTKSVVQRAYEELVKRMDGIPVFHLSTSMCAAHRKDRLDEIRQLLTDKKKVLCISTPLIEAGVDVSFECVVRSLAGLDSIAQAAGRCNRHGEREVQQVYVVDHDEENLSRLPEIERGKKISRRILIDLKRDSSSHGGHLLSVKAMERYFREFYEDFDANLNFPVPKLGSNQTLTNLLFAPVNDNVYFQDYRSNRGERLPLFLANSYRTAAEHFYVIKDSGVSVIAPYGDEGKEIIADLNGAGRIEDLTRLLKKAQQYTINLMNHELMRVDKNGGLERCLDGQVLVLGEGAYNRDFGFDGENESWEGLLMA